ncbi:MAG: TonB-dependent receptor plug domain-containing protein, partial [Myxococcota bacterium]
MVSLPRSAALLLTLLSAGVAHARSFEGTVRERGTRTPIAGAVLFLVEGSDDYDSDEDGQFVVTLDEGNLPANVTLAVESPGYEPLALSLPTPGPRETRKVDLYMTPSAQGDATTRIRDRRSAADRARGMHRISGREVNEMPGTYGDPAKAIETFPGMGRVKRSQGSLLVRGARPSDTAVYVDDFQVPDLYHFTGSTSVINIPFVDSVELVPGAFSARYGRATGGLVVLHTKKLPTDDVHGMAKLDDIDGGAYVGVPL